MSEARRKEIVAIRDVLTREEVLRAETVHKAAESKRILYRTMGPASRRQQSP